jgi:hypothetical protein
MQQPYPFWAPLKTPNLFIYIYITFFRQNAHLPLMQTPLLPQSQALILEFFASPYILSILKQQYNSTKFRSNINIQIFWAYSKRAQNLFFLKNFSPKNTPVRQILYETA